MDICLSSRSSMDIQKSNEWLQSAMELQPRLCYGMDTYGSFNYTGSDSIGSCTTSYLRLGEALSGGLPSVVEPQASSKNLNTNCCTSIDMCGAIVSEMPIAEHNDGRRILVQEDEQHEEVDVETVDPEAGTSKPLLPHSESYKNLNISNQSMPSCQGEAKAENHQHGHGGKLMEGKGESSHQDTKFPPVKTKRRNKTSVKKHVCSYCDAAFSYPSDLNGHMKKHTKEKPHSCQYCGQRYAYSSDLKVHVRNHTGERPFLCDECGASFYKADVLKRHKRTHTGERPYKCDECGQGFTQVGTLARHKISHKGEKPFKCNTCDLAFTRATNLKIHQSIHTGDKQYVCDICNASFQQPRYLSNHKLNHTTEKPWKCQVCGTGFSHSSSLSKHKQIHKRVNPFQCDVCSKSFTKAASLLVHLKSHGIKPYICNICNTYFTHQSTLTKHHKQQHPDAYIPQYSSFSLESQNNNFTSCPSGDTSQRNQPLLESPITFLSGEQMHDQGFGVSSQGPGKECVPTDIVLSSETYDSHAEFSQSHNNEFERGHIGSQYYSDSSENIFSTDKNNTYTKTQEYIRYNFSPHPVHCQNSIQSHTGFQGNSHCVT